MHPSIGGEDCPHCLTPSGLSHIIIDCHHPTVSDARNQILQAIGAALGTLTGPAQDICMHLLNLSSHAPDGIRIWTGIWSDTTLADVQQFCDVHGIICSPERPTIPTDSPTTTPQALSVIVQLIKSMIPALLLRRI